MYPSPAQPGARPFVADQVAALRRTGEVEVEVFAFPPGAYLGGCPQVACPPWPRPLRHRPRPLRADPVARTGRPGSGAGGDAARHRSRPPTLPAGDARRPAPQRSRRSRLRRDDGGGPALVHAPPDGGPARAGSTSSASTRSTGPRRAAGWGWSPTTPACCSPPTRRGPRSAMTARWPSPATSRCWPWATWRPSRSRCGSTPPTPCWCRPSVRGSAWRCSRRWPATCRCWPRRWASIARRLPVWPERCAPPSTLASGALRSRRTWRPRTRGSRAGRAPRRGPRTGWRRGCSRRGGRLLE